MHSDNQIRTKYCSNCLKRIKYSHYQIHSQMCRSAISTYLKKYTKNSPRQSSQTHPTDQQAQVFPCQLCGYKQTMQQLDTHPSQCPNKQVQCPFCTFLFPNKIMDDHIELCPKRTAFRKQKRYKKQKEDDTVRRHQQSASSQSNSHEKLSLFQQQSNKSRVTDKSYSKQKHQKTANKEDSAFTNQSSAKKELQKSIQKPTWKESVELIMTRFLSPQNYNQWHTQKHKRNQQQQEQSVDLSPKAQKSKTSHQRLKEDKHHSASKRNFFWQKEQPKQYIQKSKNKYTKKRYNKQTQSSQSRIRLQSKFINTLSNETAIFDYPRNSTHRIEQLAGRHSQDNQEGLTKQQIKNIREKPFRQKRGQELQDCAICYCVIVENHLIKDLPCQHLYHSECLSKWLTKNKTCPLCKFDTSKLIDSCSSKQHQQSLDQKHNQIQQFDVFLSDNESY